MSYIHIDALLSQSSFNTGEECGDIAEVLRLPEATYIIFADGCGHGIKANISARFILTRLKTLIAEGLNLRKSIESTVISCEEAKGTSLPYAAFTVIKILNNGETSISVYEMPPVIFASRSSAEILSGRAITMGTGVVMETFCFLEPSDSLFIMSDGITDAGIGIVNYHGWKPERIKDYINSLISSGKDSKTIGEMIHAKAREKWGDNKGDDCSVMQCCCRKGEEVTVLSGPPADKTQDIKIASQFMRIPGKKIVCGATTAKIIGSYLKKEIVLDNTGSSLISPPSYMIEGVDLATEGAVTLNQAYNILDADPNTYTEDSGVTKLCTILRKADKITFIIGGAHNPGHEHMSFIQRGIIPRSEIAVKIAGKLKNMGKLAGIEYI